MRRGVRATHGVAKATGAAGGCVLPGSTSRDVLVSVRRAEVAGDALAREAGDASVSVDGKTGWAILAGDEDFLAILKDGGDVG